MRYTQIFEHFPLEISVPFDFHPGFPEFSVEWFALRKFNNFRISQEISVPFVPFRKFRNGKRPGSSYQRQGRQRRESLGKRLIDYVSFS